MGSETASRRFLPADVYGLPKHVSRHRTRRGPDNASAADSRVTGHRAVPQSGPRELPSREPRRLAVYRGLARRASGPRRSKEPVRHRPGAVRFRKRLSSAPFQFGRSQMSGLRKPCGRDDNHFRQTAPFPASAEAIRGSRGVSDGRQRRRNIAHGDRT